MSWTTGGLLRQIRKTQGWTQEDLAERLGVTRGQVANIEAGRSDIPASRVLRVMEQLAESGAS